MPRGKKEAGCQTNSNNNIMDVIKERWQATVNLDTPMKLPIYSPSQQNHALVSKVVIQPRLPRPLSASVRWANPAIFRAMMGLESCNYGSRRATPLSNNQRIQAGG